jgi:hypothetical protein
VQVINLGKSRIKQYFSECLYIYGLKYPVKNKHVTCYIAASGLSSGTKFYTFFSQIPVAEKVTEHELCILGFSENLPIKFII